jgi:hypothetical protein
LSEGLGVGARLKASIADSLTSNSLASHRTAITEVGDGLIPDLLRSGCDAIAIIRNSLIADLL